MRYILASNSKFKKEIFEKVGYNFECIDSNFEEGKAKEAAKIEAALTEIYPEIEVEIHQGDQPVYPYLFSAE